MNFRKWLWMLVPPRWRPEEPGIAAARNFQAGSGRGRDQVSHQPASLPRLSTKQLLGRVERPQWIPTIRRQSRIRYFEELRDQLDKASLADVPLPVLLDARIKAARKAEVDDLGEMRALRKLVADLAHLEHAGPIADAWKTRRDARKHLAGVLAKLAEGYKVAGNLDAAVEAFFALEETGAMTPAQRESFASLLWQRGEKGEHALWIYLRCLELRRWQVSDAALLKNLRDHVVKSITIVEETGREESKRRVPLLMRALGGGATGNALELGVGIAYLADDLPNKALPYLKRAFQVRDKDGGRSAFHLAQAFFRTEAFSDAAKAFHEAAESGFPRSRIAAWQGLSLAKSGKWGDAYETFRIAAQSLGREADAEFYVYWGRACFITGAHEEATARFNEALRKAANDPRAVLGSAVCLVRSGDTPGAMGLLERLVGARCKFAPAIHFLGGLYERSVNPARAVDLYRQALTLRPDDTTIILSLALLLDEAGDGASPALLERAAAGGKGGPEVIRRLVLAHIPRGERRQGRIWLQQLAELVPQSGAVRLWVTRDAATLAVDAFNRRQFADAIQLWERVNQEIPVPVQLAESLLCHATEQLRQDDSSDADNAWLEVDRAHQLNGHRRSAYLLAIRLLMRGDFEGAHAEFQVLAAENPTPECLFLRTLARFLQGDESAVEEFGKLEPIPGLPELNALLDFLQIQVAATKQDYKQAAARIERWCRLPGCLNTGMRRDEANALVLACVEGAGWRSLKVVKFFEELNGLHDGFWTAALVVSRHHEVVPQKSARFDAAKLDASKLDACDAAYQQLLHQLPDEERVRVRVEYAALLRARIAVHVARGELSEALEVLSRLEQLIGKRPAAHERLHAALTERVNRPSKEKAYALLFSDPDAAREVWEDLVRQDSNDIVGLHHLACLAWSRGHESVAAGSLEAAIEFFAEGAAHYQNLYSRSEYWELLLRKGRELHTNASPFDEEGFSLWRSEPLRPVFTIFLDLASHLLNQGRDKDRIASRAMQRLRASGLDSQLIESLADEFGDRFLDRDPTNVSDFDVSMGRAEKVLGVDPANVRALNFVLRAFTYKAETAEADKGVNWQVIADRMAAVRPHAEKLRERSRSLATDRRQKIARDIASFWVGLGKAKSSHFGVLLDSWNAGNIQAGRSGYLRQMQSALQAAEEAFDRAVEIDESLSLQLSSRRSANQRLLGQLQDMV